MCLSRLISTCLKESGSSLLLILCFIIIISQIITIIIMAIIMIIIITCLKESGSRRPLRVSLKSGEEKEVATERGRTHLEKDHHHHYCNNQNLLLVPAAGPFSIIWFFNFFLHFIITIINTVIFKPFTSSRSRPILDHILLQLVRLGGQILHREHVVRYRLRLRSSFIAQKVLILTTLKGASRTRCPESS